MRSRHKHGKHQRLEIGYGQIDLPVTFLVFTKYPMGLVRASGAEGQRFRRIVRWRPSGFSSAVKLKSLYQPRNSNCRLSSTRVKNSCGKNTLAGTRPLMTTAFPWSSTVKVRHSS